MNLDEKTILVTGGTGSFGRRFVEIALTRHNPGRIIMNAASWLFREEPKN